MSIGTVPPIHTINPTISNENQPTKLGLFKRIAKIFYNLYQKISNLFSRKSTNDDLLERLNILNQKMEVLTVSTTDQDEKIQDLTQKLTSLTQEKASLTQEVESLRIRNNRTSCTREAIYDIPTNNKPTFKRFA